MDPALYKAATKGNIEVLKTYKDQLLNQITSPAKNTVLHVIAQYIDSGKAIQEILSDQDSSLLESLLTWKNSEGETAMYIATRNRRAWVVQELLTESSLAVSPDLEGGEGVTGVVSLTERMVRISNKNGDTPLHEAVNNKDAKIVTLLVKADPNYQHLPNSAGKTPLYIAAEKRVRTDVDRFKCLTKYFPVYKFIDKMIGIPVRSFNPSMEVILKFCKTPGIEGPHGETVLHAAVRRVRTCGWIRDICNHIPHITKKQDDQGLNPLHYAAYFGNSFAVSDLLKADKLMGYTTASEDKHDNMTPIHIAAIRGHSKVIASILEHCEDCWYGVTSKGQNILHLAAKGQHSSTINYIMGEPWGINLLNIKDNDGNTPSHLLLASNPKDYETIKPLLEHPNVYVDSLNNKYSTPLEIFNEAEIHLTSKKVNMLNTLQYKFGNVEKVSWRIDDGENGNSKKDVNKTQRLEEMKQTAQTHLLVAALVATMTFAAGFTLPGGYDGSDGPNQGMAVLLRKSAFKAFVVTDTIAVISSFIAIFLHFTATLYKQDEEKISNRYSAALMFLVIAMISMAIAFVTGLYVVLAKAPAVAITVCILGCFGILYLLYLIRKVYRDMGFIYDEYLLGIVVMIVPTILLGILVIWPLMFMLVGKAFRKLGDILKPVLFCTDD